MRRMLKNAIRFKYSQHILCYSERVVKLAVIALAAAQLIEGTELALEM